MYEGCTDLQAFPDSEGLLVTCASRSEDDRYWLPGTVVPPACGGPCPATVFRTDVADESVPTWAVVLSEPGMGRTSLAMAPSNPNIIYALAASTVPGPDRNNDGRGDLIIPHGWWEAPRDRRAGLWNFHPWSLSKNNQGAPLPGTYVAEQVMTLQGDSWGQVAGIQLADGGKAE